MNGTAAAQHRPRPPITYFNKMYSQLFLSPDKMVLTGNIVAVKTVIKNI